MKPLLILFFISLSISCFAQKGDTLIVPIGKYQFIKIGDKVYKLVTTLEEVTPSNLPNSGIFHWPGATLTPSYYGPSYNQIDSSGSWHIGGFLQTDTLGSTDSSPLIFKQQ